MADKQVTDLAAAGALDGTEATHIVQSGNSRQESTQDIADLARIEIEDEGSLVGTGEFLRLNFTGPGVSVTDAGGDEATINVPGGGGGGGGVAAQTFSGTNQATADIDLTSTTEFYRIVGWIETLNDAVNLEAVVTDDGFVSVETGVSDYTWIDRRLFMGTTPNEFANADEADNSIILVNNAGNDANERIWVDLVVMTPHEASAYTVVMGQIIRENSAGEFYSGYSNGTYLVTSSINGIRLLASAGNITYNLQVYTDQTTGQDGSRLRIDEYGLGTQMTGVDPSAGIVVEFDTRNTAFDNLGFAAPVSGVFTVPASLEGKKLRMTSQVRTDASGAGIQSISFERDGNVFGIAEYEPAVNALQDMLLTSPWIVVSENETLEVIYRNDDTTVNIETTSYVQFEVIDDPVNVFEEFSPSEVTASRNLTAADFDGTNDALICNSASDIILTLPSGLTPTRGITIFRKGTGEVDIAAGGGVTLLSEAGNLSIDLQYNALSIFPTGTSEEYAVIGKLKA